MRTAEIGEGTWDYIYEPDARELLDGMMRRYLEATVFQMVNENMASEQSARMVAMKAASDNAGKIIQELQLIYNKTRQAAITKELVGDRRRRGGGLKRIRIDEVEEAP